MYQTESLIQFDAVHSTRFQYFLKEKKNIFCEIHYSLWCSCFYSFSRIDFRVSSVIVLDENCVSEPHFRFNSIHCELQLSRVRICRYSRTQKTTASKRGDYEEKIFSFCEHSIGFSGCAVHVDWVHLTQLVACLIEIILWTKQDKVIVNRQLLLETHKRKA